MKGTPLTPKEIRLTLAHQVDREIEGGASWSAACDLVAARHKVTSTAVRHFHLDHGKL